MAEPEELPPGQVAREDFPRFGWGKFAFRFHTNTKSVEIAIGGDVGKPFTLRDELGGLPRKDRVSTPIV